MIGSSICEAILPDNISDGTVAERPNAPVLKTGDLQGSAGSNPARSAKYSLHDPTKLNGVAVGARVYLTTF
jgi:hypothetical protein